MSATYSPTVPLTERDWVRLTIRDTDVDPAEDAMFSDEEIDGVLAEQEITGKARKYLAAAFLLRVAVTSISASTGPGGVTSKAVSQFRATWGIAGASYESIYAHINWLQKQGALYMRETPRVFKVYPRPAT